MKSSKGILEIPIDTPKEPDAPKKSAPRNKADANARNIHKTAYRWKKQSNRPVKVPDIKTQNFRLDSPSLKRPYIGHNANEFVKRQAMNRGINIADLLK